MKFNRKVSKKIVKNVKFSIRDLFKRLIKFRRSRTIYVSKKSLQIFTEQQIPIPDQSDSNNLTISSNTVQTPCEM